MLIYAYILKPVDFFLFIMYDKYKKDNVQA